MNTYTHDCIVIGAGSGGMTVGIGLRNLGLKVLLIDRTPENFGGDCLNYGCVPSKALLHVSKQIQSGKEAESFRINDSALSPVDITKVMTYVRERIDIIRANENPDSLAESGLDIAIGDATFEDESHVRVGDKVYHAKRIVIATGSRPREIELEGLDTLPHYNNESIFGIESLPDNFVFIGGGPINIEIGQAFARLGSHVTILQSADRILDKEDADVSRIVQARLESEGVTVRTGVNVQKVRDGAVIVTDEQNNEHAITASAVFVGVGRIANVDKLAVEKAGIKLTDRGQLILDKYFRTTNKKVVAVGDAAGQFMFTHAAEQQGLVVLNNFFSPVKKTLKSDHMAWVTFCEPEIATFGQNKIQLDANGIKYEAMTLQLDKDDRSITEHETEGFLRLYVDTKGYLLGGTMVGFRAGEVASELTLMMYKGIQLDKVSGKVFPYPTISRIILDASRQFGGKSLYTPSKKWLLRKLFR